MFGKLALIIGIGISMASIVGLLLGATTTTGTPGRITAADGSFSVKPPAAWYRSDVKFSTGVTPLLALRGPTQGSLPARFVVSIHSGPYLSMAEIMSTWPKNGGSGGIPGPPSSSMLDGVPDITAEGSEGPNRIEWAIVDHGGQTYEVIFFAPEREFDQLRAEGFEPIIASWHWN